jgi:hypothetical protein
LIGSRGRVVIAERVGHESISLIKTVYSTSCKTTKIARGRSSTTRGLRKLAPIRGECPTAAAKKLHL